MLAPAVVRADDLPEGVLVDVAGETITVGDLARTAAPTEENDEHSHDHQQAESPKDRDKAEVLDELIERKLLMLGALDVYDDARAVQDSVEKFETIGQICRSVAKSLEPSMMDLTDDVLAAFKEERKHLLRGRHIVLPTEEDVAEAFRRLEAGEPFEDVAKEMSVDNSTRAAGGRFWPFRKGKSFAKLEELIGGLELGTWGGPIHTRMGYHIALCESVEVRPEPDAYLTNERLVEFITIREVLDREDAWLIDRAAEHGIVVSDETVDLVHKHLRPSPGRLPPHWTETWTPTDDPICVASSGETLTVADFLAFMAAPEIRAWPQPRNRHSIATAARRIAVASILANRYAEGDYPLGDDEKAEIREHIERDLIAMITRRRIEAAEIDSMSAVQAFKANPKEFRWPEQAQLAAVLTRNREAIDELIALLEGGATFDEAAIRAQEIDSDLVYAPYTPLYPKGSFKDTDEMVFAMEPGEHTDVIETGGGTHFAVYKLLDKRPPRPMRIGEISHEELLQRVSAMVHVDRRKELLEELRGKFAVRRDERQIAEALGS